MAGLSQENKLRDVYNVRVVKKLAERITKVYPAFNTRGFRAAIDKNLEPLGFNERSNLISNTLAEFLPKDFKQSAKILLESLLPEIDESPGETNWDGFIIVPETEFVVKAGIDDFPLATKVLYEMTKRFSSEWAIRAFIRKYPDKSMKLLTKWTKDTNVHVRRLVSEGSRPRLPLASPLRDFQKDPRPVLALLESLKDDSELYVRRSVANNINDISKDNPEIVIKTLKRWLKDASKERQWLIKHSLRTLFKSGNRDALALLGYEKPELANIDFSLENNVVPHEGTVQFIFRFQSKKEQKLMIDYRVHFMKANGKQKAKTFKLSVKTVKKGENVIIKKKHSFRNISTRKHYPGEHKIEIIVNGYSKGNIDFIYK